MIKQMSCPGCGARTEGSERFCRKCGASLPAASVAVAVDGSGQHFSFRSGTPATVAPRDPVELTGNGVASFFIGDGFFFSAILLSVLNSSVQSWLWLLLLIPAFFFFGKGFSGVWQARQIRRRLKLDELPAASKPEAPDSFQSPGYRPTVTERTTRQLK